MSISASPTTVVSKCNKAKQHKFHTMEFGTTGLKEILSSIGCRPCFTANVSVNSGLAIKTHETLHYAQFDFKCSSLVTT